MRISDWSSDVCSSDLRDDAGNWLPLLDGTNCYGEEKARRVGGWLAANAPGGTAHIRAYSDHVSDAPTFADRKSVVSGKSVSVRVDHGGRRHIKQTNTKTTRHNNTHQADTKNTT